MDNFLTYSANILLTQTELALAIATHLPRHCYQQSELPCSPQFHCAFIIMLHLFLYQSSYWPSAPRRPLLRQSSKDCVEIMIWNMGDLCRLFKASAMECCDTCYLQCRVNRSIAQFSVFILYKYGKTLSKLEVKSWNCQFSSLVINIKDPSFFLLDLRLAFDDYGGRAVVSAIASHQEGSGLDYLWSLHDFPPVRRGLPHNPKTCTLGSLFYSVILNCPRVWTWVCSCLSLYVSPAMNRWLVQGVHILCTLCVCVCLYIWSLSIFNKESKPKPCLQLQVPQLTEHPQKNIQIRTHFKGSNSLCKPNSAAAAAAFVRSM